MLYDLKIFQKVYDFLLWLKPTVERFSKYHRYNLGRQLEENTVELLKKVIRANLKKDKGETLQTAFEDFEIVRILMRLAKDYRLLSIKQYAYSSVLLNDIGKLLGGWHKKFS